ncbi:hypothetical protein [Variovorax boronicumulans]
MSSAPAAGWRADVAAVEGRRSDSAGRTTRAAVPGAGAAAGATGGSGGFGTDAAAGPVLGT